MRKWWIFLGLISLAGLFALSRCWHLGISSASAGLMARWADREVQRLVQILEQYRTEHGCYPANLGKTSQPSGRGFPGSSPSVIWCRYAALDLDDYVLGVGVQYSESELGFWPDWQVIGVLTTAKGKAGELPPFLGVEFLFFRRATLLATRGRWSFWKGNPSPIVQHGAHSLGETFEGLWNADPRTRAAAASALGRRRNPDAIQPLIEALSDEEPSVRARAAWALGRAGFRRAVPALEKAASDSHAAVRQRATWALAEIKQRPFQGPPGNSRDTGFEIRCDFERFAPGAYPDWIPLCRGVGAAVTEAVAYEGRRSFRIESRSGTLRCECKISGSSGLPDCILFEMAVLPDPWPGRKLRIGFIERFGPVFRFYNRFLLDSCDGSTGAVEFQGRPEDEPLKLGTFAVDRWILLKADLDFVTRTGKLWVNGKQVAAEVPILPASFTDPRHGVIRLVRWGVAPCDWEGGPDGVVHLDAVRISGSPHQP